MKKNIDMINISPKLLEWLIDKLKAIPKDISDEELVQSLNNLYDGISSSVIIEMNGNENISYEGKQIKCGDLTIYVNSHRVTRGDEEITLTPKEFDILYFLAKNRGVVFTKEQIYQAVWEENYLLDDSNIMAFIRKLRKKIEVNPDDPKYIITIWGIGYKFSDLI